MKKKRKQYRSRNSKKNRRKRTTATTNNAPVKPSLHTRDVNSRKIFKNAELTCQFLKDYVDLPIFSDLHPEDIEDVTSKFQAYLGVEFESDTIKKVRIKIGEEQREVYVVPLIEHKSRIDYNVQMQMLRYMAVIWYDYGKRQNKLHKREMTALKSFRYPPIIPIVYYEGIQNWTADTELWNRIDMGEKLTAYIPNFTYKVVRVHDYTNEEIKEHKNEMSLVMMFNKIQTSRDYAEFLKTSREYIGKVLKDTPQDLLEILQEVFWALLMKMNVPQDEAKDMMEHMGAKNMGYLFESAEKMDIQAERRKTQEAQEKLKKAEEKAAKAQEEADKIKEEADKIKEEAATAKEKADKANQEVRSVNDAIEEIIHNLILLCKKDGYTKEESRQRLRDYYKTKESYLDRYFETMWNEHKNGYSKHIQ